MREQASARLPERVLCIVGPTAVGKTELAAHVAASLDAEVVSADSRQVYRYMDLGTAKPEPELRAAVPHHMIDVVDPDESFDTARWCTGALAALTDITGRGRHAIVCGGTGLYVRSLTQGLFTGPAADDELRERFEREESAQPGVLYERLSTVDPRTARRIHANDRVRVVRALEVYQLTGRPLSDWHEEHGLGERRFEVATLVLELPRTELHRRIDERSRRMVAAGLVDELAALHERGYASDLTAFAAIGYREAGAVLAGELEPRELAAQIAKSTRQYAKRQLVWIRGQVETHALEADDLESAERFASRFFAGVATYDGIG